MAPVFTDGLIPSPGHFFPESCGRFIADHRPAHHRSPKGGRPRIDDRAALTDILFVLKTGIPWDYLPRELGCGCGSGMTCWRRLHEWMPAGVWQYIHEAILQPVPEHNQIMRAEASTRAETRPIAANPAASIICWSMSELPLVAQISAAQVHDSRFLIR